MELRIPPMLLTAAFGGVMWLLSLVSPHFHIDFPWKNIVAGLFSVAGILVSGAGFVSVFRARTTVNPLTPGNTSSLVVSGIYRYSRNPMYLGFLLVLVGWAICLANILTLLLGPPTFVIYLNRFQIGPEEKVLYQVFGDEFLEYKHGVRKWL